MADFYQSKVTKSKSRKSAANTYTQVNTTKNARAGQQYRTEAASGGVYHVYANGQRIFVKKPKKASTSPTYKLS